MVGLAATLVVGACGGDPEQRSDRVIPLPTEAPTTSTTTTTVPGFGFDPAAVQKVWADYQAASDALDAISEAPNPDDPRLAMWFTGPMLEYWRTRLGEQRAAGQRATYPPGSRHREELKGIISLTAETAEIDVCALDDPVVGGPSGETINDNIAIVRSIETLKLEGGKWKWAEMQSHDAQESECPGFFD